MVAVEEFGILIRGPSGSGKTSLAFGLIDAARGRGLEACFVGDDQNMVGQRADGLWAAAIPAIAGKAELHGLGIVNVEFRRQVKVGLVADIVEDGSIARMPEPLSVNLLGVRLPQLLLPRRHEAQSVRIVMAWLGRLRACDEPAT